MFGTKGYARLLTWYLKTDVEIIGYLDTLSPIDNIHYETGDGRIYGGGVSLEDLKSIQFDYIVCAFENVHLGKKVLMDFGIPERKIVGYACSIKSLISYCNEYVHSVTNDEKIPLLFNIEQKKYFPCSMNKPFLLQNIGTDFIRERCLQLFCDEIIKKNVKGSMAEVGVFKGDFASKMNALLPDRKLYLFDTFEGFDEKDWNNDIKNVVGADSNAFNNTNVDMVLEKMHNKEKCIIKKGYFPDTFDLKNEIFCLVSLDADLYNPLYSGLEVFYPLLSKGGYIMIHDYNNFIYDGANKAVNDFCNKYSIPFVPLCDTAGSAIITK